MRLFLILTLALTQLATAAKPPNIILIYTDDHGWPDIGPQGIHQDLKTPYLDALAKSGVRATNGYSSAPQCIPSRAGLLIGKYQNRFGVEANGRDLSGFDKEITVAEHLKTVGYTTAQIGKWHLGPGSKIDSHGFDFFFNKNANRAAHGNMNARGEKVPTGLIPHREYHLDACSDAALTFIRKQQDNPFFLYLAYRAPHVPLDAPKKHLDRFPGEMPERRRQALAMIAAMDDGVGAIVAELKKLKLTENTLIFYIGDNGAPLKIHKLDAPGGGPGWDGSLNEPLNGEKGMLTEGGIRVPFLITWPGTIPAGQTYDHPIIALDATATALHLAGVKASKLDGVNLIPHLTGENEAAPHTAIHWRWLGQSAIRKGKWKYLRGAGREYLFDLEADKEETKNLLATNPTVAKSLHAKLKTWVDELTPSGFGAQGNTGMSKQANAYFDHYLDGKRGAKPPKRKITSAAPKHDDAKIFEQRDKNQDNEVTLEEWIAGRTEKVKEITSHFKRRDTNKDGIWQKSEIK